MRKIDELYSDDPSRIDGRCRCQDNIFIERLWWTIEYQYLYLHSFENGLVLRGDLAESINGYNHVKVYSSLDDETPNEIYYGLPLPLSQAA
jgi:putative transposase